MVKLKYFAIIIFTILCSLEIFAKNRAEYYNKHFLGFDYFGAYSSLLHTSPAYDIAQGGYGGLGFVYEYDRHNLLMQTGINFSFNLKSVSVRNDSIIKESIIDTQQDAYRHKYVFNNRKDNSIANNIEIPLLIGYKYLNFYFLCGPKLSVLLESHSFIECDVTTTALYDRYIDEFHDMFNHALFRDKPINVINDGIDFQLGFSAYIESGYSFSTYNYIKTGFGYRKGDELVFRLAAFAEYSIPIIPQIKSENLDLYTIYDKSPVNVDAINMNHVYYTFAKNTFFQNINIGIKMTFLFNTFTDPCLLCPRYYKQKTRSKKPCKNCDKQKRSLQQKRSRY